jgi:hypothetical protein
VSVNVLKAVPSITWSNPADITKGTALSAAQLNATADVDGSFTYNPAMGTILNAGQAQALSVTFTPVDMANYTTAVKQVKLTVRSSEAPSPLSVKMEADGSFVARFSGVPAASYDIQAGSDLSRWITIGTTVAGTDGVIEFTDKNTADNPIRFYRMELKQQ